jgi:hypothetical protein
MMKKKPTREKKYTYPEILQKYFPRVNRSEFDEQFQISTDGLADILAIITRSKLSEVDKPKT